MHVDGKFTVAAETVEGHRTTTNFINAKVEMPILSVAEICLGDATVKIGKNDGTITDEGTGKVSRFVKRLGVYFIKLRVPKTTVQPKPSKDGTRALDFTRQGSP